MPRLHRALRFLPAALALASPARAEPQKYFLANRVGNAAAVEVTIPYSFGTHHNVARGVTGDVSIDRDTLAASGGPIRLPVAALTSDDPKRDCHLRESLSLDYKVSHYPADHVCNDRNQLPGAGVDAAAFPEISLALGTTKALDDPHLLDQGKEVRVQVEGTWSLHGVTRPARLQLAVSADAQNPAVLHLRGRETFHLKDFGVVVKTVTVVFVTIAVEDAVTVTFDLLLLPTRNPG
jgi:polyisoprenoid-binding protein YceI